MGLTNTPATFQVVVNNTLQEYLDIFITVYLDNLLIYTNRTLKKHQEYIKKVFQKLEEYKLMLNPDKYKFYKQLVEYLGFIISRNGIAIDPVKVKVIQEWPTPKTVKEIQSFLGLVNFYRKFILGYLYIARPIFKAIKKD